MNSFFYYLSRFVVIQIPIIFIYANITFASDIQIKLKQGELLFKKNWSKNQGFGHAKGKGQFDLDSHGYPLPFRMISVPKVNSCSGCHNSPLGLLGGGSEVITHVVVAGQHLKAFIPEHLQQRHKDRGGLDVIVNNNATIPAIGSGFVDMLARQITADLQAIRNTIKPGESKALLSKGISFGQLSRDSKGIWDTSKTEGLSDSSIFSSGADFPPSLLIKPFHQDSSVVSLREFTINAFDFHLGMQAIERFGNNTDPDGDGITNELSENDITSITLFQAALPIPGRLIPNNPEVEQQIQDGEALFSKIGCADCHRPSLPLDKEGWVYTEPNPYHTEGNLQNNGKPIAKLDLSSSSLPKPRPKVEKGVMHIPIFTDFKLHDITSGEKDLNRDALNMHTVFGSEAFFAGASRFLTARLWGFANQPPFFHNGRYTTIDDAILAHAGDASYSSQQYRALTEKQQKALITFLKTLQVLPPDTANLVVNEKFKYKQWPLQ